MDRDDALELLRSGPEGVKEWNHWRRADKAIPDLDEVDLRGARLVDVDLRYVILYDANLYGANLRGAKLREAFLIKANLGDANLRGTDLSNANLAKVNLRGATLHDANLCCACLPDADLRDADLRRANLSRALLKAADLRHAVLVGANLEDAELCGCRIYGISAWSLKLTGAKQSDLLISREGEPTITVGSLEVAQLIYLLLHNETIRAVIDTISSKVVLILGRFTPDRKTVLDAIRQELRKRDYCPVLFDFKTPATRDTHETMTTLARMARFVIADITDPKSVPQELVSTVESLPSVPVQPLLESGSRPWGMYDHIKRYPWVLTVHEYANTADLLNSLAEKVIRPAEEKASELRPGK